MRQKTLARNRGIPVVKKSPAAVRRDGLSQFPQRLDYDSFSVHSDAKTLKRDAAAIKAS
jgi:hypothetical protein